MGTFSVLIANSQTWTPVTFGDNNSLRLCLNLVLHLHIVNAPLVFICTPLMLNVCTHAVV